MGGKGGGWTGRCNHGMSVAQAGGSRTSGKCKIYSGGL